MFTVDQHIYKRVPRGRDIAERNFGRADRKRAACRNSRPCFLFGSSIGPRLILSLNSNWGGRRKQLRADKAAWLSINRSVRETQRKAVDTAASRRRGLAWERLDRVWEVLHPSWQSSNRRCGFQRRHSQLAWGSVLNGVLGPPKP